VTAPPPDWLVAYHEGRWKELCDLAMAMEQPHPLVVWTWPTARLRHRGPAGVEDMLEALETFVEGVDCTLLRAAGGRLSVAEVLAEAGAAPEAFLCLGLGLCLRGRVVEGGRWLSRAAQHPGELAGACAVEEIEHLPNIDVVPLPVLSPAAPLRPRWVMSRLLERGKDLYAEGDFEGAVLLLSNAAGLTVGMEEDDDLVLSVEANYGEALRAAGHLRAAVSVLQPLVDDMGEWLDPQDEDFIATLRNLLRCHMDGHSYGPAVPLVEDLLAALEPESEPWYRALYQKAWVLARMGAEQESWTLFEQVVEGLSGLLGPEHPDLVTIWHEWGLCAGRAANFDLAGEALRMALVLAEKNFGLMHPQTGRAQLSLGTLFWDMERLDECERHWESAVSILGSHNPDDCLPAWEAVLELYVLKGDLQKQASTLRRLTHHDPKNEQWMEDLKRVEKALGVG